MRRRRTAREKFCEPANNSIRKGRHAFRPLCRGSARRRAGRAAGRVPRRGDGPACGAARGWPGTLPLCCIIETKSVGSEPCAFSSADLRRSSTFLAFFAAKASRTVPRTPAPVAPKHALLEASVLVLELAVARALALAPDWEPEVALESAPALQTSGSGGSIRGSGPSPRVAAWASQSLFHALLASSIMAS